MRAFLLAAVFTGLASGAAFAGPVSADTWYTFGFGSPPDAAVSGAGFVQGTNPTPGTTTGVADSPAWTFFSSDAVTLTVLDQFTVSDNAVVLGTTSAPGGGSNVADSDITAALGDADYSRGVYVLAPGSHSITIQHIAGEGGAAVFEFSAVPEPASMAVLGIGLAAVGAVRRRRG